MCLNVDVVVCAFVWMVVRNVIKTNACLYFGCMWMQCIHRLMICKLGLLI